MPLSNLININAYRQALYGGGGWSDLPDILYGDDYEDRGIDDWLSDLLYVGMTDRAWEHLSNTEKALYGDEGAIATHTLPGLDGPIEVYESNGKIYEASTGKRVTESTKPFYDPDFSEGNPLHLPRYEVLEQGSTASSGGGIQGAIDAITGAITGATGGAQNPNTIWDPINRQYGQGVLKNILGGAVFNELVNTSGLGYEPVAAVNPVPSPEQSTYGGAPGPVREVPTIFPTPQSPVQGQSHSTAGAPGPQFSIPAVQSPVSSPGTSTYAGSGGPRFYTGTVQSPVNSPETSTDAGGGGPRLGPGDNDGVDPDPTDGTPTFPQMNLATPTDQSRIIQATAANQPPEWADFISQFYGTADQPGVQQNMIEGQGRAIGQAYGTMGDIGIPFYGQAGRGILEEGQDAIYKLLGLAPGSTYQDVVGAVGQANPAIQQLQSQSGALGEATQSMIDDAGVLNARERANIEDMTRGRYAAMGRGGDTAALATEIGDVTEAERLDRNRDLSTAAGLMGQQQGIAQGIFGMENLFTPSLLNAGQALAPGLDVGSNLASVAGSMGIDPMSAFGIESEDRQFAVGNRALEEAEKAGDWDVVNSLLQFGGGMFNAYRDRQQSSNTSDQANQFLKLIGAI